MFFPTLTLFSVEFKWKLLFCDALSVCLSVSDPESDYRRDAVSYVCAAPPDEKVTMYYV